MEHAEKFYLTRDPPARYNRSKLTGGKQKETILFYYTLSLEVTGEWSTMVKDSIQPKIKKPHIK